MWASLSCFLSSMCGLSHRARRNLLAQIVFSSYFLLCPLKAQLSVAWEWTFPGWMWNVELWQEMEFYSLLLFHLFVSIERETVMDIICHSSLKSPCAHMLPGLAGVESAPRVSFRKCLI